MEELSIKKQIQRKRMMTYFIDATDEIIQRDGIRGVTIRKVSDLAGYNSATLYNYFDNLDHLIFMTVMNYLKDYTTAIPEYIKDCKTPLETYFAIDDCFFKYSFEKPEMYQLLFFTNLDHKFEQYTQQYYTIFPEKIVTKSHYLDSLLRRSNIYSRGLALLDDCVKMNIITAENAKEYNEITMLIYESKLSAVIRKTLSPEEARSHMNRYYKKIFTAYINPEYLHLIDCL